MLDKVRVAERLDAFGVAYIEGGWPGSNPKDKEFFDEMKGRTLKTAKLAAFGSTRRASNSPADDPNLALLLEAETPVVTIFGKSWLLHVHDVLRVSPEENLDMVGSSGYVKVLHYPLQSSSLQCYKTLLIGFLNQHGLEIQIEYQIIIVLNQ